MLDQAVQGEDATFAVVVRLHGHEHVLYGGHQGERPDNEREGTEDHLLVYARKPAVASHDGFHHVHGAGADIAVDHA